MKSKILILVLITALISGCNGQVSTTDLDNLSTYEEATLFNWSSSICNYVTELASIPKDKFQFESYLKQKEDSASKLLREVLTNRNYGFHLNENTKSLIIYDWGKDKDDDNLSIRYYPDDKEKSDGDLVLFEIDFQKCILENSKEIRFFKNNIEVEIPFNVTKKLSEKFRVELETLLNPDGKLLLPKEDEKKRTTIIEAMKDRDKWLFNMPKKEHKEGMIEMIVPIFEEKVLNDSFIIENEITRVFFPISFFERSQLEEF